VREDTLPASNGMNLKDGLFWALAIGAGLRERAVILMYHSIADRPGHFNSVPPAVFKRQMGYLKAKRYPVVSLKTLAKRLADMETPGGAVAITFDDGYENNYTDAFPVLKEHGFPATIFVATDRIGSPERLTREQLREMESSGLVDVEPHSKTHPRLAEADDALAREEMRGSKETVENMLGKSADFFAYPYGSFSERTLQIARERGFRAAVTVREGTVAPGEDLFRLPRVSIDASTTFAQFRGKVSRAVDRYEAIKKIWK